MPETQECPVAWLLPFSVADQFVIDRLGERQREAVERYIRAGNAVAVGSTMTDDDLVHRIADAVEGYIDLCSDVESGVRYALKKFRAEGKI